MKNHIAANHFGVRYKCDMCSYEGKRKDKLNAHKRRIHEGIKSVRKASTETFMCDKCDYVSKRKYELKVHIESQHEGLRHSCMLCPYTATRKDKLTSHMKTHHPNKTNDLPETDPSLINFVDVNCTSNNEDPNKHHDTMAPENIK